ncbi:MAG: Hpt domain-containing protein [Rhodocyclales bacterium]|nr:Hpt domain-containing protein [Rhodocyclales bacterium]
MSNFVLNRALILDRLGGDEEIYQLLASMFAADIDNNCRALALALANKDAETLQREAHTIKGLLANFADDEGTNMALALEQQARAGVVNGLDAAVAALQQRLHEVAAVVQA